LAEPGNLYRIVALGESTTFGFTLNADDRPWPELLEDMIRTRLHPPCQVEVINAGLPSHNLIHNLYRLPGQILPLQPNLIISYHGMNGFKMLDAAIAPPQGKRPPAYQARPLKLLGDAEYRIKLLFYKRRRHPGTAPAPPPSDPMKTAYAAAYRQLVEIAQTNHIRLVLANYSMAVNAASPPEVVEFYRSRGDILRGIKANETHTRIVTEIAAQHPEVCFVDTHPHLDGEYHQFIDPVHLTQEGRQQMAETFFAALKPLLVEEFSRRAALVK